MYCLYTQIICIEKGYNMRKAITLTHSELDKADTKTLRHNLLKLIKLAKSHDVLLYLNHFTLDFISRYE